MPPHLLILQRRATRIVKRARPRSHSHRQRERHTAQARPDSRLCVSVLFCRISYYFDRKAPAGVTRLSSVTAVSGGGHVDVPHISRCLGAPSGGG